MKKSFIKTTLALGLSVMSLGVLTTTTLIANAETTSEATEQAIEDVRTTSLQDVKDSLNDLLGKAENDITKEDIAKVQEKLNVAIESNLPKVGDGVAEVCNYMELQQANKEMEEFEKYIDSIDLSEYQPMSEEELNSLLNQ